MVIDYYLKPLNIFLCEFKLTEHFLGMLPQQMKRQNLFLCFMLFCYSHILSFTNSEQCDIYIRNTNNFVV